MGLVALRESGGIDSTHATDRLLDDPAHDLGNRHVLIDHAVHTEVEHPEVRREQEPASHPLGHVPHLGLSHDSLESALLTAPAFNRQHEVLAQQLCFFEQVFGEQRIDSGDIWLVERLLDRHRGHVSGNVDATHLEMKRNAGGAEDIIRRNQVALAPVVA